jgi:D-3-phosphoglycerate dehydrogenase
MIGRIGTAFGEAGVNIVSAAVGRQADDDSTDHEAVMVVTTDGPVPGDVVDAVVAGDGFSGGRAITL